MINPPFGAIVFSQPVNRRLLFMRQLNGVNVEVQAETILFAAGVEDFSAACVTVPQLEKVTPT